MLMKISTYYFMHIRKYTTSPTLKQSRNFLQMEVCPNALLRLSLTLTSNTSWDQFSRIQYTAYNDGITTSVSYTVYDIYILYNIIHVYNIIYVFDIHNECLIALLRYVCSRHIIKQSKEAFIGVFVL